ncbi:MAG TPA: MJ0042-type zinc finger domain-containing protein [Gemmataceae bacterium]|nr:MJ0042-type zinc finger domain-containing protein [Gemmataceae bacterium]
MPIIIACPSCGSKLRVADELRGELLRCPSCSHTFHSTPKNESPPIPQDLPLQLAIDEPSEPRSAPSGATPGLMGAIELNLSLDHEQPAPQRVPMPPTEPPPLEPPSRTPPRLADEHDDLKECPVCGTHVHRDSTRCYHCGERFGSRSRRRDIPDIRRRGPRRDAEPHRGTLILVLGIIGLACLAISCAPIGAILGLASWIMGQTDLRKMKRGDMDPDGQGITQAGWICGIISTLLNGLVTLGCLGFIGIIWYQENNRPLNTRPPMRPVPAQKWQPKQNPPGKQNFR